MGSPTFVAVLPLLLLWAAAGCSDLFGTRDPVNRLSVRVDPAFVSREIGDPVGARAYVTVRNEGYETVMLEFPCSATLPRSSEQGWEPAWGPLCIAMFVNPTALAPGEEMRAHIEPIVPIPPYSSWRVGQALAGTYRVRISGVPERGEVIDAHSEAFRFVLVADPR